MPTRFARLAMLALLGAFLPTTIAACPMAGRSYFVKYDGWLKTHMSFNEECTEVVINFRGHVRKSKVMREKKRYRIEDLDGSYWLVSPRGTSVRLITPEISATFGLIPIKTKKD